MGEQEAEEGRGEGEEEEERLFVFTLIHPATCSGMLWRDDPVP